MAQPNQIVPLVIGRYALCEKIASGGMASVYLGKLAGEVGFTRTVAVKRLHAHLASDPEFATMFLDEARLAAHIRHPNVVPTLDVVSVHGELFLVMEYVEGESLAQLRHLAAAEGKRIPIPIAVSILSGALQGLHAAHEARNDRGEPIGIVHRDVSPHNVIVGTDGVARVLDFGVAKAIGKLHSTRQGEVKGKLRYMAPEQLMRGGSVDRLVDIFAASTVLWETLTGKTLFDGEVDGLIVRQILDMPIQPPSLHNADVPPELDDIVLRGLERDTRRRFSTAAQMSAALEEAVVAATPRKVGEWVTSLARERLHARAAQVTAVQELTSTLRDVPGAAAAEAPEVSAEREVARPRRSVLGIIGSVALLALVALVVAVVLGRSPADPKTTSTPPVESASASAPVAAAAPASISTPTPPSTSTSTPTPTPTGTSPPVSTAAVRPAKRTPTRPSTSAKPAASGSIYTRD